MIMNSTITAKAISNNLLNKPEIASLLQFQFQLISSLKRIQIRQILNSSMFYSVTKAL